ncbi:MAG: Holliday junction branch migration protein RuvA [Alphaproteobacteria bacterium]|nr:Holliday junction branch migration protein RuvA [Alphaproteobacteria bacterium]
MIGKLTGRVDTILENGVILDVQGVGYVVQASARTLGRLDGQGSPARLLIDTHVREDAISLYGFIDAAEQRWFRLLTSVQGVGPKAGMAILAACPPERLPVAIASQDKAALQAADGVGPKLALRILTELKDKAANMSLSLDSLSMNERRSPQNIAAESNQSINDAVSALVNLGYGRSEAFAAVLQIREEANDNLQMMIKLALKNLTA